MTELEKEPAYAKIILSIVKGNKTLSQVANDLDKKKPTLSDQLANLVKKGYIIPMREGKVFKKDKKTKKGLSVQYKISVAGLTEYWGKIYKFKFNEAKNEHTLNQWLQQFAFFSGAGDFKFPATIEALGQIIKINEQMYNPKELAKFSNLLFTNLGSENNVNEKLANAYKETHPNDVKKILKLAKKNKKNQKRH
jgi:hypothetical protein